MSTITSRFTGTCKACGASFPAGTIIQWSRAAGARHADLAVCEAARIAQANRPAPTPVTMDGAPIAAFLQAALDRGLKFPKVRFLTRDSRELRLSLAGSGSRYPGAVQVKVGDEWAGRIQSDGTVAGPLAAMPELLGTIETIAADPAKAAQAYGALAGRCSFCHLALTDAGSVEVGYGPICAKSYGLPHQPKGTPMVALPEAA